MRVRGKNGVALGFGEWGCAVVVLARVDGGEEAGREGEKEEGEELLHRRYARWAAGAARMLNCSALSMAAKKGYVGYQNRQLIGLLNWIGSHIQQ